MTTPEGKTKALVNNVLDSYGERIYKFKPVQTGYGAATIDYLVCADGLFVGIETKRAGGKPPTSRQEGVMEDIRRAGGSTFVIYDEEDVRALDLFLGRVMKDNAA